jgi:decaprenyl-phosphate phosphoribosyltransferase
VAHRLGALSGMHQDSQQSVVRGAVRALRPRQWMKNALVFAAPIAAGVIDDADVLLDTAAAFVAFCCASSATYLLNDLQDVELDRKHPTKRDRPIASGALPIAPAWTLAVLLVVAAVGISFAVAPALGATTLGYLALTTVYNLGLKHVAPLDILTVAAGFVLRAVAGGAATGVPISEWFFIVTSAGALFMVAGKRSGEASDLGAGAVDVRPSLNEYTPSFLAFLRATSAGVLLIAYCLWAFTSADQSDTSVWYEISILPFAAAVLRYALLLEQGRGAEPEQLVLQDRVLLGAAAAWAVVYAYAVYAG